MEQLIKSKHAEEFLALQLQACTFKTEFSCITNGLERLNEGADEATNFKIN